MKIDLQIINYHKLLTIKIKNMIKNTFKLMINNGTLNRSLILKIYKNINFYFLLL